MLYVPGHPCPQTTPRGHLAILRNNMITLEGPQGPWFYITFQSLFALRFYFCSNAKKSSHIVTHALKYMSKCY